MIWLLATLLSISEPEDTVMKGRYWYFVDNISVDTTKTITPEILLWASLPVNHKGQEVEITQIYPDPMEIIDDTINGNRIVFWRISDIKERKQLHFFYEFLVRCEEVRTHIESAKIAPYDTTSMEYKRYTVSEPWIEITQEMKVKVCEIIAEETNPYFQAKRIFDWVVKNVKYEYPDVLKRGAQKTFNSLKGDCGEFSMLFCALCRSIGIPARTVTCTWFKGVGHQWTEVLFPPYGWIPVDPSVAQMLTPWNTVPGIESGEKFMKSRGVVTNDSDYLFGNLYPYRVMISIGNNIEVSSKKLGITRVFKFMQPGGNTAYPFAIEINGLSDKTVHGGFYLFGDKCDSFDFACAQAEKELAQSYMAAEIYDKAESGFKNIVQEKPNDASVWLSLGQIYLNTGKIDDAIKAFKNSIEGKVGSRKPVIEVWAHNLLGICYQQKGLHELAIKEWERVIEMGVDYQGSVDFAKEQIQKIKKQ